MIWPSGYETATSDQDLCLITGTSSNTLEPSPLVDSWGSQKQGHQRVGSSLWIRVFDNVVPDLNKLHVTVHILKHEIRGITSYTLLSDWRVQIIELILVKHDQFSCWTILSIPKFLYNDDFSHVQLLWYGDGIERNLYKPAHLWWKWEDWKNIDLKATAAKATKAMKID